MKRLLLPLLAALALPPAVNAEEFTELNPINPYSYNKSSVSRWEKKDKKDRLKRYITYKGTTQLPECFYSDDQAFCINNRWWVKIINKGAKIIKNDQIAWDYEVECNGMMFRRKRVSYGWMTVRVDPTAEIVAKKYCPMSEWKELPNK